jgi:hypothetical protein
MDSFLKEIEVPEKIINENQLNPISPVIWKIGPL